MKDIYNRIRPAFQFLNPRAKHPSGNIVHSEADTMITQKIKDYMILLDGAVLYNDVHSKSKMVNSYE